MSNPLKREASTRRLTDLESVREREEAPEHVEHVWQVTAVSAPTCTVKMSYDGVNLIDQTETTGVSYDPNSAPSVGDQGMLLRLGSGAAYFFSRAAAAAGPIDIVAFTAFTYNVPGTAQQSATQAEALRIWSAFDTSIDTFQGLLRLDSAVAGARSLVLYNSGQQRYQAAAQTVGSKFQFAPAVGVRLFAAAITDVIPANPTYAEFAALSEEAAFPICNVQPLIKDNVVLTPDVVRAQGVRPWFEIENGVTAYGFRLYWEHVNALPGSAGAITGYIQEGASNQFASLDLAFPALWN